VSECTPLVVVLAGPNGAGKSTTAPHLLKGALAVEEFVNADVIAQGLSAFRAEAVAVTAGRVMLDRLHVLAAARRDFAFETTLAGRGHARWLQQLRSTGYLVHLLFLSLPSADLAIARVVDRVRRGGHHVPEDVVRRRYAAGLRNLVAVYAAIVDSWQVFDNSDFISPILVAAATAGATPVITDQEVWERLRKTR
jgi:predicted ABC-type ATPase